MILSIHQPSYFPWLGLLHKIANSDLYMIMDEVQLTDKAYQHRNIFLSADGKTKFLTISFNKKEYFNRPFKELEIIDQSWRINHLNFISNGYKKHPFFEQIFPCLTEFFAGHYPLLIDAVMASMLISMKLFDIKTKLVFQSDMDYDKKLRKGELVVDLVRASGADCYLSGTGAAAYMDESVFTGNPSLKYDSFIHPVYPQKNSSEFISGLSCLDILFNVGIDGARSLIRQ
jgi:hypothetical protein